MTHRNVQRQAGVWTHAREGVMLFFLRLRRPPTRCSLDTILPAVDTLSTKSCGMGEERSCFSNRFGESLNQ
jgi:hypothetical protein